MDNIFIKKVDLANDEYLGTIIIKISFDYQVPILLYLNAKCFNQLQTLTFQRNKFPNTRK